MFFGYFCMWKNLTFIGANYSESGQYFHAKCPLCRNFVLIFKVGRIVRQALQNSLNEQQGSGLKESGYHEKPIHAGRILSVSPSLFDTGESGC